MSSYPQPERAPSAHRYALFDGGRRVGWLEWRFGADPPRGWFLVLSVAVPDLAATAVGSFAVLEGRLSGEVLSTVVRRLELLGGEIVAVFAGEPGLSR